MTIDHARFRSNERVDHAMRERVFIGFGSNLGDRLESCDRAVNLLALLPASAITGVSSLYETEPVADVGDSGSGMFLNGVVRLETELSPRRLLETCLDIERALGRDQQHRRGPRTMDLDILAFGHRVVQEHDLHVPHPRLHRRRFVLAPLAELQADWEHPVLRQTARQLLDAVADSSEVRRLDIAVGPRYHSPPAGSSRAPEG